MRAAGDLPATIGATFQDVVSRAPEAEFVVTPERTYCYREIDNRSAALACDLLRAGVGKGVRVGIFFTYSAEWVVAWLAAMRIGALVVPLSTLYKPPELRQVVVQADLDTLIVAGTVLGASMADKLEAAFPDLSGSGPDLALAAAPYLRRIWTDAPTGRQWGRPVELLGDRALTRADAELLAAVEPRVTRADLAVVVFTSGTSAEPKGVVHTHGSVLSSGAGMPALFRTRSHGADPRVLCGMPFFWVGGLLTVVGALLEPAALVLLERFEAGAALAAIARHRATMLMGWPSLVQAMRAHPTFADLDLSSAVDLVSGPADYAAVDTIDGLPRHRGMSESMGTFTAVEVKVIDPETGRTLPNGADGELCIRGPGLMHGYYNRDRAEVFDADGWFHSGDRVVVFDADPRPYYVGRYSDLIKAAGANVSPREVEMVVEALPGVVHCFVFGAPHETRGEEVVAVVVPAAAPPFDERAARSATAESLSAYKVPTRWIMVSEEDVPWLATGKPDRRHLRRQLALG